MDKQVLIWWGILLVITLLNIVAWIYSAVLVRDRRHILSAEDYLLNKRLLVLAGIYVIGCSIRAVLPRVDAERIVLIEHWLSSILVGRAVATVAELCFIAQWALLLYAIGKYKNEKIIAYTSYSIVPVIFIAEIFSWVSTVTTINLGHIVEESLWTVAAVLILICFIKLYLNAVDTSKILYSLMIIFIVAYISFMLFVDIPMYYEKWQSDVFLNQNTLSVSEGFEEISNHMIVIGSWKTWQNEVPWMTLYFSIAVWSSIALSHVSVIHQFKRA